MTRTDLSKLDELHARTRAARDAAEFWDSAHQILNAWPAISARLKALEEECAASRAILVSVGTAEYPPAVRLQAARARTDATGGTDVS